MPNPRAQRQLTLDRVVSDLKSFAEPAQAMGDMMAGALRGSVAGTAGATGDISDVARTLAPDTMQTVFGRRVMPTTEEMNKMLPPAVPQDASPSRKHTAEMFGALGEFAPAPLSGTVAKGLSYGLGRGAGALTRGAGKAVNDAMVYNTGPLARGSLSFLAPRTATMHVVKPEGGNWTGGAMMNSVENNLNRFKVDPVLDYKNRIELAEKKLTDPNLNEEGRDVVQQRINGLKSDLAINNWVGGNLGNYVKNKMATINDPVRLMFEKRVQDVESKYAKDIERSERIRERAQQETDPRRQANLMREANTLMHEAEADRDLAMRHITHLPDADVDEAAKHRPSQETQEQRYRAGFKMLGEAESAPARAWENMSDMGVEERRAGDIQETMGLMPKAQEAERVYRDHLETMDNKFRKFLTDKNVLKDSEIESLVDKMSWPDKAQMIGDTEWEKLRSNMFQLQAKVQGGNWHTGERNPWIAKLDPEATLYSGDIAHLGFDHVVDILKQDLRAGRIRPEQLNKITVDQAIQRTAEFDMEQAKKMAETQIKATEGFPVHKEYPEGYKWIELKAPAKELPAGWTVREAESPISGERYQQVYNEQNNEIVGAYGRTKEEALKKAQERLGSTELESALKYEGDTMGHCVGGYCPDVIEGRSRIYSLRDMRGEPHVTVEVNPGSYTPFDMPEDIKPIYQQHMKDGISSHGGRPGAQEWMQHFYPERYVAPPDSIRQIKGKQNKAPKEQYLPYVQDFVRSGNWEDVGDIKNTGLIKAGDKYATEQELSALASRHYPKYPNMTPSDVARHYKVIKESPDYQSDIDKKFIEDFEAGNYMPPETGMKKGGKVSVSDNCDCHQMAVIDQHMSAGGSLSKVAIEALERMKALRPEFQARTNLLNKYKAETVGLPYNEVKPFQMTNEQIREEMDRMAREQAERQQVEQGKAGGGAIKKLAKVITSSSDELALPSKLPRAKPRTKEDLRPLAQEMAEATRGDFYRPNPAKSINPAGKSFDQWKMEQGLVHDIRPTALHQAIPRSDIEKQKGMVKMGISGDTSVAEQVLHEAGPYALDIPSPQHGGALYGLGGEGAWASNNPIASNVQKRINEISQAYGGAPILGQYMQMGKLGTDFALHFADANLRAIDLSKMTPSQIEAVNELIRKGSPKSGARPSFPGIQDKDSAYLHFAVDPELRKHFNAIMQKPTYTEPLGLPDGRIVHHAITEPELRDLPVTTTGFSQMELQSGFDPESLSLSAHPTYSHVIPHKPNTGLTRTQVHLPAQVDFPDVHEYVTQTGPKIYRPEDLTRVYQTSTPRQIVDQQHIDEIKMFEELMKQYGGKKKGGAVKKMANGGQAKTDRSDPEIDAMFRAQSPTIGEKFQEHVAPVINSGLDAMMPFRKLARTAFENSVHLPMSVEATLNPFGATSQVQTNEDRAWMGNHHIKNAIRKRLGMDPFPEPEIDVSNQMRGVQVNSFPKSNGKANGGAITGDDLIIEERPL